MCGIAGMHFFNSKKSGFKNWEREIVVNDLLLGIESRGKDATGIATVRGNGDIWVEKAELEASEFVLHRTALDKRIKSILLHTRYATKGHQSENLNNHPVINGNAVIIHNGVIRNDDELFKEDESLERTAEVDSEIIAALFQKHGIEKAHLALQELDGGFAIAAIDQRKPTALVLARGKHNPLTYYRDDNFLIWSSESRYIVDALAKTKPELDVKTIDCDFMQEGDILYFDNGGMEKMSFKVKNAYVATQATHSFYGRGYVPGSTPSADWESSKDRTWNNRTVVEKSETDKLPKGATVPRFGTYEMVVDGRRVTYRCCYKCGIAANVEYFQEFDGGHWCPTCFEDEVEWLTSRDTGDTCMAGTDSNSEIEEEDRIIASWEGEDHMLICEKIGKVLGMSKGMVDYFLFECEELMDGEIQNDHISAIYDQLVDLYDTEVGLIVGDEVEKAESAAKKMELVKLPVQDEPFISL